MAKGKRRRKPQANPNPVQAARSVVPSEPIAIPALRYANREVRETTPKPHRGAREGLRDYWREVVIAGLLVGLCLLFVGLWAGEYRAHEETKGKLDREQTAKTIALTERDQARKELEGFQKENAELKRLHPILEFYGPRAKLVTSYDLIKEVGASISIGPCPAAPCYRLRIDGIREKDGITEATIGLSEAWKNAERGGVYEMGVGMPLKRGCSMTFLTSLYDITFAIEDDGYNFLRAGIGLSPGTYFDGGFKTKQDNCLD
jgi:hypothetical protein